MPKYNNMSPNNLTISYHLLKSIISKQPSGEPFKLFLPLKVEIPQLLFPPESLYF